MKKIILIILIFVFSSAFSVEEKLQSESQEALAQKIFEAVKCVVCEGQSISDSDADLAYDMRALIRKKVAQGEGEEKILEFMSSHYGQQILLKPPVNPSTYILWYSPFFILVLGTAIFLFRRKVK